MLIIIFVEIFVEHIIEKTYSYVKLRGLKIPKNEFATLINLSKVNLSH